MRKLLWGLLGTLLGVGALVHCVRKAAAPDSGKGLQFALSIQSCQNPVFQDIEAGLQAATAARGDRLVTSDAQFSTGKQTTDIATFLDENPAVLFINPVNWEAIRGSLIEASRRGIPVIVVDAPVSVPGLVVSQITSDNFEAGRMVCRALADKNPRARVVILHLSLNRACIERVNGFKSEMAAHSGMGILDTREGKGRAEGSYPVMRAMLERYPELDAVFAVNDPSAVGAIRAIAETGRTGTVDVVAVDGSAAGIEAIRAGQLLASAEQSPREIGRIAAENAYAFLAGKPCEKNIKLPVRLLTRETLGKSTEAPETREDY